MNRILPAVYNTTNYIATDAGFQHGCLLRKVRGYFRGSSGSARWLQIHDSLTLPADTAVPVRSLLLTDSFDIYKDFGPDGLKLNTGLCLCVSTTQATKTISTDTADWMPEVEEFEDDVPSNASTAGNLTTARETLQVWAETYGPKRLIKVEVKNNHATDTGYVQIHCGDAPLTNKLVPPGYGIPILAGQVKSLSFGVGIEPSKNVAGTVFDGCTVALSSTQATYTAWGANDFTIKAWYK